MKAIVPLIGATVVGFSLLTFLILRIQQQQLERNLTHRIESTGTLIEETISTADPAQRDPTIQSIIELFGRQPDIWRVEVLSPDGRILYSSLPSEKGGVAEEKLGALARELLSHPITSRVHAPFIHRREGILIRSVHPVFLQPDQPAVLAVESSLEGPLQNEREIRAHIILVAAVGMVLVSAMMLFVLAVLVHRPVLELTDKISRARRGQLDVAVSFAERADEIGELGRDFNEMVRQLRESCQQCEQLYEIQVTQAEHLATIGEVAAGLAHEIKNPLAGIAGAIEIISQDLPPSNPHREVMKDVQREMLRIKKILADLLSYARPKPPHLAVANLNEAIASMINLARQQTHKQIGFRYTPDPNLPPFAHDPDQMRQMLFNLLLNGVQAIEESGEIRIEAHAVERTDGRGPEVQIAITDTGRGIPPERLSQIFKPFYTTKGQGTGLGLSLSRRIADQHGGTIQVESQVGRGTKFLIRLPLKTAVREPASVAAGSRSA